MFNIKILLLLSAARGLCGVIDGALLAFHCTFINSDQIMSAVFAQLCITQQLVMN